MNTLCDLDFIQAVLLGKCFSRAGGLRKEDAGLIFHVVGVLAMKSGLPLLVQARPERKMWEVLLGNNKY